MSADGLSAERGDATGSLHRAHLYLVAFVAGLSLSLVAFYGGLATLRAFDRLPPPPVSGTWCIDSRLAWLKQNPDWKEAELIAVGSSATWRNLDFGVVNNNLQRAVNVAPCFVSVNQTRYLTEFLVERAPQVKTVMTVLAPRDFEGCSRNPTAFFDPELVDQYTGGQISGAWLRFRNFRLRDVFFHAIYAGQRRPDMIYDRYGSGPFNRSTPDTGHPFVPENGCYQELRRLAAFLESKGIQFVVATLPVMQGWSERHDPTRTMQAQFRSAIQSTLSPTKAILVDGIANWRVPNSGFADPVHLQWPETAAFTRFVWISARGLGAHLPELEDQDQHSN